mmetsp:Transcript_18314/g.39821  ORF Transcript_18314/g.39821 Transcript_18314/m.39821 type:complete len:129 (-) Transcript_18314:1192-1578(-)
MFFNICLTPSLPYLFLLKLNKVKPFTCISPHSVELGRHLESCSSRSENFYDSVNHAGIQLFNFAVVSAFDPSLQKYLNFLSQFSQYYTSLCGHTDAHPVVNNHCSLCVFDEDRPTKKKQREWMDEGSC